jgi:phosphatidylglycerophosphatase C
MDPGGQQTPGASAALPTRSTAEVLASLEEHTASGEALAMDADGTLWSGDVGVDAFTTLLARRALRPAALPALQAEARAHGVALAADANEQAARIYEAFEVGRFPEDRAFTMMAWAPAGHDHREMLSFARAVIDEKRLASRLHAELGPVLDWAERRRVPVYVVSASPDWIIAPAIERLALPVARIFAMRPAGDGDVLLARIEGPATYGAGKLTALHSVTAGRRLIGAFGDSAFDLPMLREAAVAVAVRPKPALRQRSHECPGLVELLPGLA